MAKEKTTTDQPETATPQEDKQAAAERTYFFPDIQGHQIAVKASSQEEARKKADAIAADKSKKGK